LTFGTILRALAALVLAICALLELGEAGFAATGTVGFGPIIGVPNPGTAETIVFPGSADRSALQ